MPFGFICSPYAFDYYISPVIAYIRHHLPSGVEIVRYVDDILLAGPEAEPLRRGTQYTLAVFRDLHLPVSETKVVASPRTSIDFLGFMISRNKIAVTEKGVQKIENAIKNFQELPAFTTSAETSLPRK